MRDLLERHNPILVIFPQDPSRARPGAFRPRSGWGDYHPCTAEFFLDRAIRRDRPERYDYISAVLSRFQRGYGTHLEPDRIDALRAFIGASRPEQTALWELDVCEIPSQDPERAWEANARFLAGSPADGEPSRAVTYARAVPVPGGTVLQYWYLYIYNDFFNQHEADWEMATILLDADQRPLEVAYSNHHGGVRRRWRQTPREGDRPLLYVSRGSHAGHFRYASGGHPLIGDISTGNLPRGLAFIVPVRRVLNTAIRLVQRVPGIRLYRDHAPADPLRDTTAPAEKFGVRLSPALEVLPREDEVTPDHAFWWLRFRGHWGSTRPRVVGSIGVLGPWASMSLRDLRWRDPVGWIECCKLEDSEHSALVEVADRIASEVTEMRRKAGIGGRR